MSASCELTQGVGGTWATCPTLLRDIWARGRRAGFHHHSLIGDSITVIPYEKNMNCLICDSRTNVESVVVFRCILIQSKDPISCEKIREHIEELGVCEIDNIQKIFEMTDGMMVCFKNAESNLSFQFSVLFKLFSLKCVISGPWQMLIKHHRCQLISPFFLNVFRFFVWHIIKSASTPSFASDADV